MNFRQWMWCLHCERCFSVFLDRKPKIGAGEAAMYDSDSTFEFAANLEMQLGVESDGQVYAECPYDDCDAGLQGFWWWEQYEWDHHHAPETPEEGVVYRLYP